VSIGRGATGLGGATGTMTVRNVGRRPCRITNFTVPEQRVATSRLEIVRAPAQGRLIVIEPNVVAYTPNAGYAGPMNFSTRGAVPAATDGRCPSACGSRCVSSVPTPQCASRPLSSAGFARAIPFLGGGSEGGRSSPPSHLPVGS
jgi:hypothetical protein